MDSDTGGVAGVIWKYSLEVHQILPENLSTKSYYRSNIENLCLVDTYWRIRLIQAPVQFRVNEILKAEIPASLTATISFKMLF